MWSSLGCQVRVSGETGKARMLSEFKDVVRLERKVSFEAVLRLKGREREMCRGRGTPRSFSRRL